MRKSIKQILFYIKLLLLSILFVLIMFGNGCIEKQTIDGFDEQSEDTERIIINLSESYCVGESARLELSKDVDVEWIVSDDSIAIIDNNYIIFLREGTFILTAKLANGSIGKAITIFDKEGRSSPTQEEIERNQRQHEEYLKIKEERQKEAEEHGFSNWREYQQYLAYLEMKERYENELLEADKLGLSYEEYYCLEYLHISYEEIKKRWEPYGIGFIYGCEDLEQAKSSIGLIYGVAGKIYSVGVIDEKKGKLYLDELSYIKEKLPNAQISYINNNGIVEYQPHSTYSTYYSQYVQYNLYGEEVDTEMINEIMKVLEEFNEK